VQSDTRLRHVIALLPRWRFADPALQRTLAAVEPETGIDAHELASLRAPTLLVWGARGRILPERHRDRAQ